MKNNMIDIVREVKVLVSSGTFYQVQMLFFVFK